MAEKLQVGDTVRVKSGGPQMTIADIDHDQAQCQWFDNNQPNDAWFKLSVLVKAIPRKKQVIKSVPIKFGGTV